MLNVLRMSVIGLLTCAALAACGSSAGREPRSSDPSSGGEPSEPSGEAPGEVEHWEGLVRLAAIEGMPVSVQTGGYPGHGFRVGVFENPDAFQRFLAASGVEGFPSGEIDWIRQRVAYVVLDAQTNRLHFERSTRDGNAGVVTIVWDHIEPFYEDATPAVLVIVDVTNMAELRFELAEPDDRIGAVLGTVPVSAE